MKLNPRFGGLPLRCPAQHSDGIGRAVQRQIGLPQPVQVGGIIGAQPGGPLQVRHRRLGFSLLIVEGAAGRESRGEIGLQHHGAVQVCQALRRIALALRYAHLVVTHRIVGMPRQKLLQLGASFLHLSHAHRGVRAVPPGEIVVRYQLEISVPRRERIFESSHQARGEGQQFLNVGAPRSEFRSLHQQRQRALRPVQFVMHVRQADQHFDILRLLPARRLEDFARPLVVARRSRHSAQIEKYVEIRGRYCQDAREQELRLIEASAAGQRQSPGRRSSPDRFLRRRRAARQEDRPVQRRRPGKAPPGGPARRWAPPAVRQAGVSGSAAPPRHSCRSRPDAPAAGSR